MGIFKKFKNILLINTLQAINPKHQFPACNILRKNAAKHCQIFPLLHSILRKRAFHSCEECNSIVRRTEGNLRKNENQPSYYCDSNARLCVYFLCIEKSQMLKYDERYLQKKRLKMDSANCF